MAIYYYSQGKRKSAHNKANLKAHQPFQLHIIFLLDICKNKIFERPEYVKYNILKNTYSNKKKYQIKHQMYILSPLSFSKLIFALLFKILI